MLVPSCAAGPSSRPSPSATAVGGRSPAGARGVPIRRSRRVLEGLVRLRDDLVETGLRRAQRVGRRRLAEHRLPGGPSAVEADRRGAATAAAGAESPQRLPAADAYLTVRGVRR